MREPQCSAPQIGHGQLGGTLTRNDDEGQFPLNPARATHHGRPAGQIETTSRVITKMWAEHEQNMQALLDKHYQKVKDDLNRNFQHEPQAAEKEENKISQALAKLPPEPQRPRQDKFDSRGFPVYDDQPFLAHQMEPQNRICVVKVDGVQRCLWCDARDHNTMCCIKQCPRCAGSHGIHDCPRVYQDTECSHCMTTGHVEASCLKRVLGDFSGQSRLGAQPNPKKRARTGQAGNQQRPKRPTGNQGYNSSNRSYNGRGEFSKSQEPCYNWRNGRCRFGDRCRYTHEEKRDFARHLDRNNSVVVSQVRNAISESDLKHAERIRQVEEKIASSHERVAQLIAQGRIAAAALAASQQTGDKHRVHPDRNSFQQVG